MRSIQKRFAKIQEKRPDHSSLVNFAAAVKGQKFNSNVIGYWYKKLVDCEDFEKSEKRKIVAWLVELSNAVEATKQG